ncbi:MAG: hypothetical protein ACKPGJ_05000, partial [Dolichospermum sp.]
IVRQFAQILSRLALKIVVMTRERGTGNREQVFGNFTFCYLCRFFSVHLLIQSAKIVNQNQKMKFYFVFIK